jgi:hypothetical protein
MGRRDVAVAALLVVALEEKATLEVEVARYEANIIHLGSIASHNAHMRDMHGVRWDFESALRHRGDIEAKITVAREKLASKQIDVDGLKRQFAELTKFE